MVDVSIAILRRAGLALLVLLASVALLSAAQGQTFPRHVDPNAREEVPDLSAVPALRFLTTTGFPPFNYRDASGELVGFNVDLAQAICERLSARCTIQAWPWDQAQEALADNQGDALIAGVALTGDAADTMDFSRIYMAFPARFVTRSGSASVFDPRNLTGPLAVRAGTAHERFARKYLPEADIVPYDSEIEALEAVAGQEAYAYFGDAMRASFWLNRNPDCCAFAGEAYFRPDYFGQGLAIAFPPGLDRVRTAVNWALTRLQLEGKMDELYLRWFPVSFY